MAGALTDAVIARFWSKVDKSGDCWTWTAAKNRAGYGTYTVRGESRLAHRIAVRIAFGIPLRPELVVMHQCDNPACVRPDHLLVGTVAANNRDMALKGRASNAYAGVTHCPQGHPYDDRNTYVDARGKRFCRTCQNARRRARRVRRREREPWRRKRLTDAQALDVRRRASAGEPCAALAAEYGLHVSTIQDIRAGRTFAALAPAAPPPEGDDARA